MPSANFINVPHPDVDDKSEVARTRCTSPLIYNGLLDIYAYSDVTPVIGRVFSDLQVKELLGAEEEVFQDLAVTSQ